MGGVPLHVLARNLGHVDTRMVERVYGHLEDSYVRDAIRKGAPSFGEVQANNVSRANEGKLNVTTEPVAFTYVRPGQTLLTQAAE